MRRFLSIAPLALLLGLELCLFDPLQVVGANASEFSASVAQLAPILALASLLVSLAIAGATVTVPSRFTAKVRALLLALALLLWIQRSFLLHDYGLFDGRGIPWDRFRWQGFVDIGLWLVALGLALRHATVVVRHATFLALGLILLQGGSLALELSRSPDEAPTSGSETGQAPPPGIFQWSSERNVVHIILDSFQTDVFAEIVEAEGWADALEGFDYYPENMGVAISTSYSVPAIFSGEIYDGEEPFSDYFERTLGHRAFPARLREAGFVVNLIPHLPLQGVPHDHYFAAPALWGAARDERERRAAALALDVSLFRHSPHFVRRWVHADGDWRISRWVGETPAARSFHQKAFFRDWISGMEVDGPEPRYHFLHLMPPHPPYVTLPDGSYAGEVLPSTRENFLHEARAVLGIFVELLEQMKAKGIYDSSLIVLHGDHGSRFAPVMDGHERRIEAQRVPALLAIKRPGGAGPLRALPQRSSLADLPATVLAALGLSGDYPGADLGSLEPGPRGGRHFFVVDDPQAEKPTVVTYRVEGSIYDPESWSVESSRTLEREVDTYVWGNTIQFGVRGNAQGYQGRGWSQPAGRAEWTNGPEAELYLRTEPASTDMMLEIVMRPFLLEDRVQRQRVEVLLNGQSLARLNADSQGYVMFRQRISRDDLQGDLQVLRFRLPDCASPAELGAGGDRRCLGISVGQVRLRPLP